MIECPTCHKFFKPRRKSTIYCSIACRNVYARAFIIPPGTKGKDFICKFCKKVFFARSVRIKNYNVQFCGRSCQAKSQLSPCLKSKNGKKEPKKIYKRISVNGKQFQLHRYIMEQFIGRPLLPNEHVHHINLNHLDNRIENLVILSPSEHLKLHHRLISQVAES